MGVKIVQLVNNTSHTLHYHNTSTDHSFSVGPLTERYENNDWVPSSNYHEDLLPQHSTGEYVGIRVDDLSPMRLSNYRSWKFSLVSPMDDSGELEQTLYDGLDDGQSYVVRVDEVQEATKKKVLLSFYKYVPKLKVTAGYVALQTIQHAGPVVAMVLMAIFL